MTLGLGYDPPFCQVLELGGLPISHPAAEVKFRLLGSPSQSILRIRDPVVPSQRYDWTLQTYIRVSNTSPEKVMLDPD